MRRNDSGRAGRAGFTLIELLIVMAIIAILVSLTAAAVYKVIQVGPRTACRTDIGELETAVQNFQNKFGVDYIPSRIRLVKNINSYGQTPTGLNLDSRDYMLRLFPKLAKQDPTTHAYSGTWASPGINWTQAPGWNGDSILEGHQCLVFFLGGIQVTTPNAGCVGFSTNPNDPSGLGGDRVGPFYDFKSSRLQALRQAETPPNPFLSYLDPFSPPPAVGKKPYAYFSHYKTVNGYNRYATLNPPSDNHTLGLTAGPYALALTPAPRYYKPDSFQIISAGPDGLFGPGGVLAPGNTAALGPQGEGRDNMTNFVPGRLEGGE